MPFALIFIGLMMIVSGARDTHVALGEQLTKDFTGPGNFTVWIVAIFVLGAIGYNDKARPFSHAFMALVLVAMLLSNKGFFQKFSEALAAGPKAPPEGAPAPVENKSQGAGGNGSSSIWPSLGSVFNGMKNGPDPNSFEGQFDALLGRVPGMLWNWARKSATP